MPRSRDFRGPRSTPHTRRVDVRELRQRFLIVCEGAQTEPNYFRSFRLPRDVVAMQVEGSGYNTISLVQEAIRRRPDGDYDQVWCVFDRDSFPAQNFNEALALAERNNIRVAYSNEAFELWYLLHFNFYNTGISRRAYIELLSRQIPGGYSKNRPAIYDLLESRQQQAIDNAKRLLARYNPRRPEQDNPSTTVHLLVEELRRFMR